jgi:hypothetical protein
MTQEHLKIIKNNCAVRATDKEYIEAYMEAVNLGYASDDGWSSNPSALIAFIDGFLIGKG